MHQLQKVGLWPGHAQLLDHTKADTGAAVHGRAGRLIDDQQLFIFKQYWEIFASAGLGRRGLGHGLCLVGGLLRKPHRRQAHHVAGVHPGGGLRAALVDPDFATADDAVDVGFGDAFELAHQKIVQALARGFGIHREHLRLCGSGKWRAPYNVFH